MCEEWNMVRLSAYHHHFSASVINKTQLDLRNNNATAKKIVNQWPHLCFLYLCVWVCEVNIYIYLSEFWLYNQKFSCVCKCNINEKERDRMDAYNEWLWFEKWMKNGGDAYVMWCDSNVYMEWKRAKMYMCECENVNV